MKRKDKRDEEAFFTRRNEEVDKRHEVISPSGRFKLTIRYYSTKPGCWDYSRGTVVRISDGKEVCDIKRNYGWFVYSFVTKENRCETPDLVMSHPEEWLIAGRSYMSQTIVNLETGDLYEPPGDQYDGFAFCWAGHKLSPDGNTLMVEGCHWACPYEYRFYDFTDPSRGWAELEIVPEGYLDADGKKPPVWKEDGTLECYETREMYKPLGKDWNEMTSEEIGAVPDGQGDELPDTELVVVARTVLRRNGDKMETVEKWVSEEEQKRRDESEEANRKFNEFVKSFKASDGLYLTMNKRIAKQLLPASWGDWWGWKENERTVGKYFSTGGKNVEIRWGVESGPIAVEYYKGKEKRRVEFERSEAGMIEALKAVGKQFGLAERVWHYLKTKLRERKEAK